MFCKCNFVNWLVAFARDKGKLTNLQIDCASKEIDAVAEESYDWRIEGREKITNSHCKMVLEKTIKRKGNTIFVTIVVCQFYKWFYLSTSILLPLF